jgi:hypothetical protein
VSDGTAAGEGAADADPGTAPSPPTPAEDLRRVLRVAVELGVVALLLGVVGGLVWSALAPEVELRVVDDGAFLDEVQGARVIGRDGWFAVVGAAGGVLLGLAGWWRHRDDPVPLVVGLAVAGVLGSAVVWRVGTWAGPDPLPEQLPAGGGDGATVIEPLAIGAPGVLVAWSVVALAVVAVLALLAPGPARHVPTHSRRSGAPATVQPGGPDAPGAGPAAPPPS